MWICGFLIVGAAAHVAIFMVRDYDPTTRYNDLLDRVLRHRDAIISHLNWAYIFLGFHSFGATAPSATAPGATSSTSLTLGGGDFVAVGPLGTADFLSSITINGWLSDFLWAKALGISVDVVIGEELIESIVWAHIKLKVALATQPRALSIVQGRADNGYEYLKGIMALRFPRFSQGLALDSTTCRIWFGIATAHDFESHDDITEEQSTTMADALISIVVEQLINILTHQAQELIRTLGVEKEIKNLSSKLEKIREVLDDAEKKSFTEEGIKLWIEDIKNFSYEVDDVLDEWRTRTLR
nr:putative photosystem I PsaA/PsaB [Ipomoea batatas]